MPFQITSAFTCYLMPGDGPVAEQQLLQHMNDPGETYIIAYAFTLTPMINEIMAAHQRGVPIHIYLDSSQLTDPEEEPLVKQLAAAGVEVTIGTSPEGSQYICHTKGLVSSTDPVWCWEGSTNFSDDAWHQVNTAMCFSSQEWHDEFVGQFIALRQFAWSNERSLQVMAAPPPGVAAGQTS